MISAEPSKEVIKKVIDQVSDGQFKVALDKLNRLLEQYPNNSLLLNISGACCAGLGNLDEAVKFYKKAIEISPNYAKAYFNLAGTLQDLGDFDEAILSYQESLKIQPDYAEAHNNLGNLFREIDNPDEAINSFEKAIKIKPKYVQALFSLSLIYQDLGLYDNAVNYLKKVLKIKPNFANAFNNLGIALKELNNIDDSIKAYKNAININHNFSDAHNNLGNAFKQIGNHSEAISSYENAIKINASYPAYYNNLGILLSELKQFDRANLVFESALALNPGYPDTYNNIANLLSEQGHLESAIENYKQALSIDSNYIEAFNNLGNAQKEFGAIKDAIASYKSAIKIDFNFSEAHNNLGNVLKDLKKFEDAINCYTTAISLNPNYFESFNNLGIVYFEQGSFDDAIDSFNRSLELNPNFEDAYSNLGILYFHKNDPDNAVKYYKKAISINPHLSEAHDNLGTCLKSLGEVENALECYKKALAINPYLDLLLGNIANTMMNLCLWEGISDLIKDIKKQIDNGKLAIDPFELMALVDDPRLLRKVTELYSNKNYPKNDSLPSLKTYQIHKKIKLGYFSADFRLHPVTTLTVQLYELHDREKFEIHAFSFGHDSEDEMNQRIRSGVDHYHDLVKSSDKEIAELSRSLEIDIAIDLGGYTEGSRTNIFAYTAAPIQLSYIGYLGTMGSNYFDYLIADEVIIPKEYQKYYSEKIIYLPSFQVNDSNDPDIDKTLKRKDFGLPDDKFIFCSFNNTFKVTPKVFDSWSSILKKASNSILIVFAKNESSRRNLINEMNIRGVESHRLIFSDSLPRLEYLARNKVVDLFLDTFPYNAGTTSSDSLRMGLPVLTILGHSFANRMGASLLTSIDMPELISNSQKEYEEIAVELALDKTKYKQIKNKLSTNIKKTSLFNTVNFTKNLETAFTLIYERHHNGDKPNHIYIRK